MVQQDWVAILLTFKLAVIVTVILVVICTPLAWWIVRQNKWWKIPLNTLIAMPLILPPTVIGFYLLVLLNPGSVLGQWLQGVGIDSIPFTFTGLIMASCVYSLPFVMQPIQNAVELMGDKSIELAQTMGYNRRACFFRVVLPCIKNGVLSAAVLGFAHTVGEFGIVLMIGGNIPGETQLVSLRIYDYVEAIEYSSAHHLALIMTAFSFVTLLLFSLLNRSAVAFQASQNDSQLR